MKWCLELTVGAMMIGTMPVLAATATVRGVEWSYTVANGTATVTGVASAVGNLVIPESLDGYPVKAIGHEALSGCMDLTSIELPEGLETIERSAFKGCTGLTNIGLPDSLTSLGWGAFEGCTSLAALVLPAGVTSWGNFCSGCTALENIGVADGNPAFISRDGVLLSADGKQLVAYPPGRKAAAYAIPDGVETLGSSAFRGCGNLETLSLPSSMSDLRGPAGAYTPLMECSGLMEFLVADGNACFSARDGILYDKAGKTLLLCSEKKAGRSFTIPPGTTAIGNYAFDGYANLEQVVIPEGVTNIGQGAFYESGLTSVATPKSVTSIGNAAFSDCNNLTEATIAAGEVGVCFMNCSALESVTFGTGVTSIDSYAFSWSGVQTVYAPMAWKGTTNPLSQTFYDEGMRWDSEHTFEIVYFETETPGGDATTTTPVSVPHGWLQESAADILAANGGDYEVAAKAPAANGRPVWECYVADVSATDATENFKTALVWEDGQWVPKPSPDRGGTRAYTVQGASELAGEESWGPVTDDSRFFRVKVALPE